jgi:autophagy-related protein 9
MLLLSPFYITFMVFYFVLRNAEEFYHNPTSMTYRRWSNLAKWNFREFNEVVITHASFLCSVSTFKI